MNTNASAMTLNHLSFPCIDAAATAAFFEKHLDCSVTPMGASRVLKRAGFDIVLEQVIDRDVTWPQNFHLGFELASLAEVQQLYRRFQDQGVELKTAVYYHERGSRFFCEAPGGLQFEINTRADASEKYQASFSKVAQQ